MIKNAIEQNDMQCIAYYTELQKDIFSRYLVNSDDQIYKLNDYIELTVYINKLCNIKDDNCKADDQIKAFFQTFIMHIMNNKKGSLIDFLEQQKKADVVMLSNVSLLNQAKFQLPNFKLKLNYAWCILRGFGVSLDLTYGHKIIDDVEKNILDIIFSHVKRKCEVLIKIINNIIQTNSKYKSVKDRLSVIIGKQSFTINELHQFIFDDLSIINELQSEDQVFVDIYKSIRNDVILIEYGNLLVYIANLRSMDLNYQKHYCYDKILYLYRFAAFFENPHAIFVISQYYRDGVLIAKNFAQARATYTQLLKIEKDYDKKYLNSYGLLYTNRIFTKDLHSLKMYNMNLIKIGYI